MSAELGDPEPVLGNPMGLVLDRLTVPDLEQTNTRYPTKTDNTCFGMLNC